MHVIIWYAHIVRYLLKTVNCQNARCVLVRKFSTIVAKKRQLKMRRKENLHFTFKNMSTYSFLVLMTR